MTPKFGQKFVNAKVATVGSWGETAWKLALRRESVSAFDRANKTQREKCGAGCASARGVAKMNSQNWGSQLELAFAILGRMG
jgi:hypothetical protein